MKRISTLNGPGPLTADVIAAIAESVERMVCAADDRSRARG